MSRTTLAGQPWSAAPSVSCSVRSGAFDLHLVRLDTPGPADLSDADRRLYEGVREFTMTTAEAVYALTSATRHVVAAKVPGAVVECGVWRGGSMQAVARTLTDRRTDVRDLYLFDTFEGMPPADRGRPARRRSAADCSLRDRQERRAAGRASLDDVRHTAWPTCYPSRTCTTSRARSRTPPGLGPERSPSCGWTPTGTPTKHALEHLYPRLVSGGVLILDDYGWWQASGRPPRVLRRHLRRRCLPGGR